jgi:hypothetical protein
MDTKVYHALRFCAELFVLPIILLTVILIGGWAFGVSTGDGIVLTAVVTIAVVAYHAYRIVTTPPSGGRDSAPESNQQM